MHCVKRDFVSCRRALLCMALAVACSGASQHEPTAVARSAVAPAPVPPAAAVAPPVLSPRAAAMPDFADLAAQVMPAVVSIQVEQQVRVPLGQDPFGFFHFYGQQAPRDFANKGIGSGFVIDREGLILTNHHVIDQADSIVVTLAQPDGGERSLTAKVVGSAPDYDVALLRTEQPAAAPYAMPLGDSGATRIGEWVMAVGNPFGLDHSVSVGIISAKDRRDVAPSGKQGLYDFLQTDASINPGNSGGPLINLRGEVIGINAAINAQGQGIGFAIPINMVKEMLPQLKAHGTFVRSWLGVQVQPLTEELAKSFGLDHHHGVLIAEVLDDGPAKKAGIASGDIVLQFGGKKLHRTSDLQLFASMAGAGRTVPVVLYRDGKQREVNVTLAPLHPPQPGQGRGDAGTELEPGVPARLGLAIADIPPGLGAQLGLRRPGGALVQRVLPGGQAERAGLQRGDVILQLGSQRIADAQHFAALLGRAPAGEVLRLQLLRQGTRLYVALKKPSG